MLEVELKSRDLKEYVYLELEKNKAEPLYDEDLEKIFDITLNSLDLIGEPTDANVYDLIFFKNLKSCSLFNMDINDKEVDILGNLEKLEFLQIENCNFKDNKKLKLNITDLVITDCKNVDLSLYENIKSIEKLHIVNCENVNLKGISDFDNLSKLFLQNIELNEIDEVENLKNLKYLNLNGSQISENKLTKFYKNPKLVVEHEKINALYDEEY